MSPFPECIPLLYRLIMAEQPNEMYDLGDRLKFFSGSTSLGELSVPRYRLFKGDPITQIKDFRFEIFSNDNPFWGTEATGTDTFLSHWFMLTATTDFDENDRARLVISAPQSNPVTINAPKFYRYFNKEEQMMTLLALGVLEPALFNEVSKNGLIVGSLFSEPNSVYAIISVLLLPPNRTINRDSDSTGPLIPVVEKDVVPTIKWCRERDRVIAPVAVLEDMRS